jgi:hypothetical protein
VTCPCASVAITASPIDCSVVDRLSSLLRSALSICLRSVVDVGAGDADRPALRVGLDHLAARQHPDPVAVVMAQPVLDLLDAVARPQPRDLAQPGGVVGVNLLQPVAPGDRQGVGLVADHRAPARVDLDGSFDDVPDPQRKIRRIDDALDALELGDPLLAQHRDFVGQPPAQALRARQRRRARAGDEQPGRGAKAGRERPVDVGGRHASADGDQQWPGQRQARGMQVAERDDALAADRRGPFDDRVPPAQRQVTAQQRAGRFAEIGADGETVRLAGGDHDAVGVHQERVHVGCVQGRGQRRDQVADVEHRRHDTGEGPVRRLPRPQHADRPRAVRGLDRLAGVQRSGVGVLAGLGEAGLPGRLDAGQALVARRLHAAVGVQDLQAAHRDRGLVQHVQPPSRRRGGVRIGQRLRRGLGELQDAVDVVQQQLQVLAQAARLAPQPLLLDPIGGGVFTPTPDCQRRAQPQQGREQEGPLRDLTTTRDTR